MTPEQDQFASLIVDQAVAVASIPWPCPSEIGPDNRYRLEELIAVGASSFVYRATDCLLSSQGFDATVAVKIVRRRESARSEALPARRVEHPNIARVLDRGPLDEDHDFTVLEFVPAGTLADVEPGWPPHKAAAFMAQVARGVQAAHSAGVAHLDLKPSNILLTDDHAPKVTDFGLARLDHEEEGPARGTRAFMSPEQGRQEPGSLTPPSDIYALGGLLYYLVRGEPPNSADGPTIDQRHRQGAPPPPLRANRDLDHICAKALAPNPADRYAAAAQFADDLSLWLQSKPLDWTHPPPWRRLRLWGRREPAAVAGALAAFVLIAAAVVFWRMDEMRTLEQQRLVLEETEKELERTRAFGRGAIRQLTSVFKAGTAEEITGTLIWLNLLYDFMIIEGDEWVDPALLTEAMQTLIDDLEATGQGESIEALLARSTLAFWNLRAGDGEGARRQLAIIDGRWGDIIPETDSCWVRHRAMEAMAEAMIAIKQDAVTQHHLAALRQSREELQAMSPGGQFVDMVETVLERAED